MQTKAYTKRDTLILYLKTLRDEAVQAFESFEDTEQFKRTYWEHRTGGGGEISLIRGSVFEKAAVNWSAVSGESFPMKDGEGPFFATGVSLITHMMNPHAPTVHFNIRYIETEKGHWFGGGYDLTPMGFPYKEDTAHFHHIAEQALEPFGEGLYPLFKQQAKDYFYIPHRKKERGVGGIFFDHYNSGNFDADLAMWQSIGSTFLAAIIPIYKRRVKTPFNDADKALQNKRRAEYVEFNLIYDRGTKFGFQSGGNPNAILCSMPPTATW